MPAPATKPSTPSARIAAAKAAFSDSLLFGPTATDPPPACWSSSQGGVIDSSAWRAARIDPMVALRDE
jgi:hypothetical protein